MFGSLGLCFWLFFVTKKRASKMKWSMFSKKERDDEILKHIWFTSWKQTSSWNHFIFAEDSPKKTHDKTCTTSITGTPSPGRSSRMFTTSFKEVKNWFSIPDSLSAVTSKTNTPHLIPTVLGKLPGFLVRLGTAKTCSSLKVIKKQHPCTRWFKVTLWSPIWRSLNHLKGHGSPSQKGHQQNCQV